MTDLEKLTETVAGIAAAVAAMQNQVNAVCSTVLAVKAIMDAGYEAGRTGRIAPARPAARKRGHLRPV